MRIRSGIAGALHLRGWLLGAVLLSAAACTTVPPAQVASFGAGVDKVKLQLDTTFAGINQMVTEDEISRAVTLDDLTEEDVGVVLRPEDVAKWDKAFAAIDQYVANLNLLLSPDSAAQFGQATEDLGAAINKLSPNALPSPGVSTAFAELGRLLIEVKAQSDAMAAARTADPGIQQIFTAMAAAVGETSEEPLRKTVWEHWMLRMRIKQVEFHTASANAREAVVKDYIDLRDQRDAQDLQLASLRRSLLDLAAAHAALARGATPELNTAIAAVQQELEATRAFADYFKSLKPQPKG